MPDRLIGEVTLLEVLIAGGLLAVVIVLVNSTVKAGLASAGVTTFRTLLIASGVAIFLYLFFLFAIGPEVRREVA